MWDQLGWWQRRWWLRWVDSLTSLCLKRLESHISGIFCVSEAHEVDFFPVELILSSHCVIKFHYLEYGCHCLVIKALPITYVVQLFRVLIGLMSNLFDVFEIAQMLSSQTFKLFVKQLLQLTNFFEIPIEVLPEFLLSFGHIEDLIWNLFGFLFELLTLSSGHLFVYLDDLISHLGKYSFHVGDLRICQQVYCVLLLCEDIFLVLIIGLFEHV